jgi:uncharacterized protein (UPF0333 family)
MITVEFVLGIIFVVMSVTALIFCVSMSFASNNGDWLWSWIPILIFIIVGAAMISETPRECDVLNNKAHYVEVYHTYDNDTVKTYYIEWNKKTGGTHR